MFREFLLPSYPGIEVATTHEEIADLIDPVATGKDPAFCVTKELGLAAIYDVLVQKDWYRAYSLPAVTLIEQTPVRNRIPFKLRRLISQPDHLHWDGQVGYNETALVAHVADLGYRAIFATPTKAMPNVDDQRNELEVEQIKLWAGDVDSDKWKDVRLYKGKPGQPVVFRSSGLFPIAHDFQTGPARSRRSYKVETYRRNPK